MKQQGKTWRTAEGQDTLAKYLPAHERLFEKLGQKIAAEAVDIEQRLREAKSSFIDLCQEALRNNPDQGVKRRFTFSTFDKEFKIEFDIQEKYVRVYRATKSNPTSKDYELVNMDFNKSELFDIEAIDDMVNRERLVEDADNDSFDGIAYVPSPPDPQPVKHPLVMDEIGLFPSHKQ